MKVYVQVYKLVQMLDLSVIKLWYYKPESAFHKIFVDGRISQPTVVSSDIWMWGHTKMRATFRGWEGGEQPGLMLQSSKQRENCNQISKRDQCIHCQERNVGLVHMTPALGNVKLPLRWIIGLPLSLFNFSISKVMQGSTGLSNFSNFKAILVTTQTEFDLNDQLAAGRPQTLVLVVWDNR